MISESDHPDGDCTGRKPRRVKNLIIGAGPAGIQMGFYFEKTGCDYLILERGERAGSFFEEYPRHRMLISINKVYTGHEHPEINLRWDWNSLLSDHDDAMTFKHFSREYFPPADDFVRYIGEFASHYDLKVRYRTEITRISKDGKGFLVTDSEGNRFAADQLVIATGLFKPHQPDIPGIEWAEDYTKMSIDPEDFANQRVLILGKGNSAMETANHLIGATAITHIASPTTLKFAWRTHHVGHVRSVNNAFLDSYLIKAQNALLDADITRIERRGDKLVATVSYNHANGEVEEIEYDRVLTCTGFQFDDSLFDDSCRPELAIHDRFPAQTCEWESTNIPSLYFAGTLTQMRDFKKKQSGFIHGFRYNCQLLFRIMAEKHNGAALGYRTVGSEATALTKHLIHRCDHNSSMWQQTGFFCDAIVLPEDGGDVRYYEDFTIDYAHQRFAKDRRYFLLTMEFGQDRIDELPNVFNVPRVHKDDFKNADQSTAIHPVVREYAGGKLISTHHVIEDFESEFHEEVHVEPLKAYLSEQLAKRSEPEEFEVTNS